LKVVLSKPLRLAILLWALTLMFGTGILLLANVGAPTWVLVPTLLWLATLGLPTTIGVALISSVWGTMPALSGLPAFLCCAASISLAFQILSCLALSRWCLSSPDPGA